MSKLKHSPEWMVARIREYLNSEASCKALAKKHDISETSLRYWILIYKMHGEAAFFVKERNNRYSADFKKKCVMEYLCGKGSIMDIAAKYNISGHNVLRRWLKRYNANIELKDYDPHREVYMASARRKTTKDERLNIVKYCIDHGNDYKNTAIKFDVSYSQVYVWTKKYYMFGEDALTDKRGRHKSDKEVDELERLHRENKRLKRQLEEQNMTVELLKKVKEFERK